MDTIDIVSGFAVMILLLLFLVVFRWASIPKRRVIAPVQPPRRRRKFKRLCPKHATKLSPGEVALLDNTKCDICTGAYIEEIDVSA